MKMEQAMFSREIYISNFFNKFFILQTVPYNILNSGYFNPEFFGNLKKIRNPGHFTIFIKDFAKDSGSFQFSQFAEIDCSFSMTGPPEYSFIERSEEHTSELQSLRHLVCRLLL